MGFFQKLMGGNKAGGGKMGELFQTLKADLNLNSQQADNIQQAFRTFKEQRREIKSAGGDRAQIQNARKQMKDQMMSFLTDQQKQTFMTNTAKYDDIFHGSQD